MPENPQLQEQHTPPQNIRLIKPDDVVIWKGNGRQSALLKDEDVADLLTSIKAMDQVTPAIARLRADGQLELLTGCRRRHVAKLLGRPLLVEVRKVDDRHALAIATGDNEGHSSLSTWERAQQYQFALHELYHGNESELAKALGIDKSTVNRVLDVLRLPELLLKLFSDKRLISKSQVRLLTPLLNVPESRAAIVSRAGELAADAVQRTTNEIFMELRRAGNGTSTRKPITRRSSLGMQTMVLKPRRDNGATITIASLIQLPRDEREAEIKKIVKQIEEYLSGRL